MKSTSVIEAPASLRCASAIRAILVLMALPGLLSCAASKPKPLIPDLYWAGAVAVAWPEDGAHFAVANHRLIWIFETETLQLQHILVEEVAAGGRKQQQPRYGLGNSLVFISDHEVASAGMGAMLTVWDIRDGRRTEAIGWPEADGYPISLSWSPATATLAAGTGEGRVFLARPGSGAAPVRLEGPRGPILAIQFGENGHYLGAAGGTGDVVIWDTQQATEMAHIPVDGLIMDIQPFGRPGQFLVAGKDLAVWNFLTQQEVDALGDPDMSGQKAGYAAMTALTVGAIAAIAMVPVAGPPAAASIASDAALLYPMPNSVDTICSRAVAVTRDGRWVADMHPGVMKEKIRIIETSSGEVLQELNPRGGDTCDLAFSPAGNHLLIANQRGASLYDTTTWQAQRLPKPTRLKQAKP